jgi:cytochrome o ubiquinol oxidase operon protein cyoD
MATHAETKLKFGAKPKTLPSYLTGLFLSVIFTMMSFGLVMMHILDKVELYIAITILAVCQLFAQVICFLRLNTTREGQWNTMPFIFTFVIVSVILGGSLWIMYNLNVNMM